MQVREMMSSPAITIAPVASVQEIARIMRQEQISGLPVVDGAGRLQGLVTELDLISRSAPVHQPTYFAFLSSIIPLRPGEYREYRERLQQALATNAEELMGVDDLDTVQIGPDAEIDEVMERMLDPEITLLVVVEDNEVVGVVTRTDMVRVIEKLELELIKREE
ncbi:MAG: CBS domain-containing protein [Caldilineaceae bacterium]|nr:CBS domain-containing protein [Caldilineaceae bacterium]MCB9138717.1 CBS domain-containing protein [Caldilineaceae bacterium]